MSQSAKRKTSQYTLRPGARHGWARAAGEGVLAEATGAFARAGFSDTTLLLRWNEIAGPQISRIAQPLRWQDGQEGAVLTLKCEAGAAVLLQHQTRALIGRLNAYLGAGRIARLRLIPGRLSAPCEPAKHPLPDAEVGVGPVALPEALDRLARLRARLNARRFKRPD